MSNSDPLKLIITFRYAAGNKTAYNPVYVKAHTERFFKKLTDYLNDEIYEYTFEISPEKSIDFDAIYKANLYEIEVSLYFHVPQTYNEILPQIFQAWCDPKNNPISNLWLRLANPLILHNNGKLYHSDVDIQEIAFGTLPDMHYFMTHYNYRSESFDSEIGGSFLHSQKKSMIFTCFSHLGNCKPVHNKFQFNYESISRVIINYIPHNNTVEIYFQLRHIPFIYIQKSKKKKDDDENTVKSNLSSDQDYQAQAWERTLDFGCACKNGICTVEKIGRCHIFKVVFPKKQRIFAIIQRLIQRCTSDTFFHFASMESIIMKFQRHLRDFEIFPFNDEILSRVRDQYEINELKFKCQYAWEVVNSRSLEVKDQMSLKYYLDNKRNHWEILKNKLKSYFRGKANSNDPLEIYKIIIEALSKSLYNISEMISKNLIFSFEHALKEMFNHYLESNIDEEIPEGMCIVRRIVLTPSKIICLPPTEHFDNRVIREFGVENFLRVSIQDDNFQKLTYAVQYNSKREAILYRVVKSILLKGLNIGPKKYEILAASNSQLREHGLWMYAEDKNGHTAEEIRKWMGNFSHIKNVAKYMARMGQCFSTSDEAVQIKLNKDEVIEIDDIKVRAKNGTEYKFTDGVGKISKDLAKEVQIAFAKRHSPDSLGEDMYDPSAFQIRFGGCKGMLAIAHPDDLTGRKIAVRPSMNKFPCPSSSVLEIVKISAPRAVFLNRPLITILENLGVKPNRFMELQKKMVFDLTDSLIYDKKALKMFENSTSLPFPFRKLYESRISLTQEPFFRSLLLCVYKSMIGNLKRKARIAVPPKYGRNMMGVVDETNTLNYGQIFVQYSEKVGSIKTPTKILKGTTVVTKNPCMHPGDVRKFQAIDVPQLHHIKDCIVFPAKGKRPHPDEMGGSDLDGDEYVVIWEPTLIFPESNYEAMDYPPNEEDDQTRPIDVEDMVDFICRYIQHDNIGLMANAYLAWADHDPDGIFSKVCQSIAIKYPQALDFAKSGTTKYLEPNEKPSFYPDFMEKGAQNNSYKSEKSLGLLYRVIRNLEASVSNISNDESFDCDLKLEMNGWKQFESLAKQRRNQYAERVKSVLKKYGLKSEAEALTGFLSNVSDVNRNKYDSENISLLAKKYLFHTMKRYYYKFVLDCNEANSKDPITHKRDIQYLMASAWYMVTYCDNDTEIFSFPWVVSEFLSEICINNTTRQNRINTDSMFIHYYDNFLYSCKKDFKVLDADACFCTTVLNECIYDWIKDSSFILTESSNDVFCQVCFERIIDNFRSFRMFCCSRFQNQCTCHKFCSPMKILLEFFKFYAAEVIPEIESCTNWLDSGNKCQGFRISNLQSLAFKTYAIIATAQGLPFRDYLSNISDNDPDCFVVEGDPVRVKVTKEFEEVLTGKVEEACEILKELSGVKQIHLDGCSDRNAFYLLVHSIGKAFNRWNLEELIMDPKCPSIIKARLK